MARRIEESVGRGYRVVVVAVVLVVVVVVVVVVGGGGGGGVSNRSSMKNSELRTSASSRSYIHKIKRSGCFDFRATSTKCV